MYICTNRDRLCPVLPNMYLRCVIVTRVALSLLQQCIVFRSHGVCHHNRNNLYVVIILPE